MIPGTNSRHIYSLLRDEQGTLSLFQENVTAKLSLHYKTDRKRKGEASNTCTSTVLILINQGSTVFDGNLPALPLIGSRRRFSFGDRKRNLIISIGNLIVPARDKSSLDNSILMSVGQSRGVFINGNRSENHGVPTKEILHFP